MLAGEGERLVELAPPGRHALAGTGIDQIEREPGKDVAGMPDRGDRLVPVMTPAEHLQRHRIERLYPERHPVHPRGGKRVETSGFGGIRVGFEGDFDIGRHPPA